MQGVPKKLHISSNFSPFVWCRKIINDILLIMFIPVSSKLGGQEVESKSLSSFCHWRCLFGTAFPPPIIPWLGIHFSRGKSLDYPKLEWQFNVLRWSFSNNKVLRCKIQHSWQLIKSSLLKDLQKKLQKKWFFGLMGKSPPETYIFHNKTYLMQMWLLQLMMPNCLSVPNCFKCSKLFL